MEYCNYYGRLNGKLLGKTLGIYVMDETFKRLLERYNNMLIDEGKKTIHALKKDFKEMIKSLDSHISKKCIKKSSKKAREYTYSKKLD